VGIVVQKYGGSSVADATGIKRVAQRIVATRKAGHDVVVVVSAMGDTTDELRDLAEQVTPLPPSGSRWRCWPWRSPSSATRRSPSRAPRPA